MHMQPERFSTRSMPAAHQLDAWRGWFQAVFDVLPGQSATPGFGAESVVWALDGFAVSRVSAPPLRSSRTNGHIRRNPVDHWAITIGNAPTGITTLNASLTVPAKVPFIVSLGNELVSERSHDDRLQFYLARDAFRDIAPLLDAARGSVLNTPLGQLLGDYMLALEKRLPSLAAADLPPLRRAVGAMLAAALEASTDRIAAARVQIDFGVMERVRQVVRQHLQSSKLDPALLCRLVGVSRSHLYRLCEHKGGVARYIQEQRLLGAHEALGNVAITAPISAIAEQFCFADAASFSRAFRREFGVSPSDVRAAARVGLRATAMPRRPALLDPAGFRDLLRGV